MCEWKADWSHQVCMPINGRVQCIDKCISHIVAALVAGGVETEASCCGHGKRPGTILLADGRWLLVCDGREQAEELTKDFPPINSE